MQGAVQRDTMAQTLFWTDFLKGNTARWGGIKGPSHVAVRDAALCHVTWTQSQGQGSHRAKWFSQLSLPQEAHHNLQGTTMSWEVEKYSMKEKCWTERGEEGMRLRSHAAPLPLGLGSDHTGEGLGSGNLLWQKFLYK